MTGLKDAINLTTQTINQRAVGYRNLVVLIAVVLMTVTLAAAITGSAVPLLGLLLIFPLGAGFLALDSRRVDCWRNQLLRWWAEEDLDLGRFATSVASIRILPSNTMGALIKSLPTGSHPLAKMDQSRAEKRAVAVTLATRHAIGTLWTLCVGLAYSAVLASIGAAIGSGDWRILWGSVSALPVLAVGWIIRFFRIRSWRLSFQVSQDQGRTLAEFLGHSL